MHRSAFKTQTGSIMEKVRSAALWKRLRAV